VRAHEFKSAGSGRVDGVLVANDAWLNAQARRIADLATQAALSAPTEGRALYAGLRALNVPEEPVARLWHAATLLREHRGDGHNAALLALASGESKLVHVTFPLGLLFCMVPLPESMLNPLQTFLQYSSAKVVAWLFALTGIPASRVGLIFYLPNLSIEVADECSGIHSTVVLLLTCLVAGYFFLRNPWNRIVLVGAAVLLGILRNAFRIWLISWLCIHVGPEMIDSPVHHQGGPAFFYALQVWKNQ